MATTFRYHRPLRQDEIEEVLADIGAALAASGQKADIYVAGGAAMALRYGVRARDVTDDVDALFGKDKRVLREAERIAHERGLDGNWLNDHFSPFMPREQDDVEATVLRLGGLTVRIASPRFLLAMKMHAGRDKDRPDAVLLVQELKISSAADVAELTVALYGENAVPAVDPIDIGLYADLILRRARRGAIRDASVGEASAPRLMASAHGRVPAGSPAGGRFATRSNSAPTSELS